MLKAIKLIETPLVRKMNESNKQQHYTRCLEASCKIISCATHVKRVATTMMHFYTSHWTSTLQIRWKSAYRNTSDNKMSRDTNAQGKVDDGRMREKHNGIDNRGSFLVVKRNVQERGPRVYTVHLQYWLFTLIVSARMAAARMKRWSVSRRLWISNVISPRPSKEHLNNLSIISMV